MPAGQKLLLSAFVAHPASSFLEWLAYHRAIGVTDARIFIDRRQAGKQPLFDALAAAGAVTLVPVAIDPDMKEEIHNSAIRAARAEADKKGGYGLYLATDEYFCIHGRARSLQSLMRSCGGADVLSAPVRIAGTDAQAMHRPGPVLDDPRAVAPAGVGAAMRSVARLGLFKSRNVFGPTGPAQGKTDVKWVDGDGNALSPQQSLVAFMAADDAPGTGKASILKIPAPAVETFLLRLQALPPKQHPAVEAQVETLKGYCAIEGAHPGFESWREVTAAEIDALVALPGVADAQNALCAEEAATCDTLRATSEDFKSVVAACRGEAVPTTAPQPAPAIAEPDPRPEGGAILPPWFAEIHTGGDNEGFYTRLKHHAVVCIHRDPARLVVTFDNLSNVNDLSADREPWAYKFVRDNGFSHLSVMARRKDWYRDPQLIDYLQKLSADGFFAEFDKVILTGTSMGGFAALAFASLSPGATVISFNPQTTLEEAIVPWEKRFGMGRARNWSLPHSDCAFEIAEVEKAFVLYDPFFEPDRRHIERLEGDNLILLKTWCSGHFSPVFLRRAGLLKPLMQHVFDDTLTAEVFYDMFRARRRMPWYRKSLIANLEERGHDKLAARVTPAFRKLKRQAAE